MARPRMKTRIDRLADAVASLQQTRDSLQAIDLRSARRVAGLSPLIQDARDRVAEALHDLELAFQLDVPARAG